ncbi:hypothetical protein ACVRXQ_01770 [Streptococcus panodentis]|uniref:Uncharacterized protein n=1 Tax=Streptococcus panodentis TaxID=1581472 RepID=A0ABS5AZK0_9STRE|nr:hypothetical protein [Streptococcus panodentis]MBP2622006.1 hypothetical protein [Streptococcus panodentis]
MKIIIGNKELSDQELAVWRKRRLQKAAKTLGFQLPQTDKMELLEEALLDYKMALSDQEMRAKLAKKLKWSQTAMAAAAKWSKKPRKKALTTIFAPGLTAAAFSYQLEELMLTDKPLHRKINLSACPDHYLLRAEGEVLEVIETAGNSPLPAQFFISFDSEEAIEEPRDPRYPYQSVGAAKLQDGSILGGIRHQFRDTAEGLEARLLVEFPSLCPDSLIRQHQLHLAAEWSLWIGWCREAQKKKA